MKEVCLFLFCLNCLLSFGQEVYDSCDSIYKSPETPANFNSPVTLVRLTEEMIPIIYEGIQQDEIISNAEIQFTVNSKGKIIDINFPRLVVNETCKEKLRKILSGISPLIPATNNGKNVCSVYQFKTYIRLE